MAVFGKTWLVFDPGKTTGYGWLTWTPGQLDAGFRGGELGHFDFLANAEHWIKSGQLDGVLGEGYKVTERTIKEDPSSKDGLWSVKQLGCVELWCHQAQCRFVQQMPSDKKFGTDEKLRAAGWYKGQAVGEKGHRRDAARHALKFAVDHGVFDLRRLLP